MNQPGIIEIIQWMGYVQRLSRERITKIRLRAGLREEEDRGKYGIPQIFVENSMN